MHRNPTNISLFQATFDFENKQTSMATIMLLHVALQH